MQPGMRKVLAFYITLGTILLVSAGAVLSGVAFTGAEIITINAMISTLAGVFFGANFGVHWAQSRRVENGK